MAIIIQSIKMSDEEREGWKAEGDICPRCNEPFGRWKQLRLDDGTIIHRNCSTDNEYIRKCKEERLL